MGTPVGYIEVIAGVEVTHTIDDDAHVQEFTATGAQLAGMVNEIFARYTVVAEITPPDQEPTNAA